MSMPPKQPPLGGPGQQPPRYAAPGQPLNAQMLGAGGNLNVNIMSNAKQGAMPPQRPMGPLGPGGLVQSGGMRTPNQLPQMGRGMPMPHQQGSPMMNPAGVGGNHGMMRSSPGPNMNFPGQQGPGHGQMLPQGGGMSAPQQSPMGGNQSGMGGAGQGQGQHGHHQGPVGMGPGDGRILSRQKIQDLVAFVDPNERLDPDAEDLLMLIAEDFVESVAGFSCRIANHRGSKVLEVKDVQLHLEKSWNMRIHGYSDDDVKVNHRPPINESHRQRLSAVRRAKK